MKKFIIACSLLLALPAFAETNVQDNIELSSEKGVERHYYHFGTVRVHSYVSALYRVTNTGATPLTLQRATISGMGFHASTDCRTILPGQRCSFRVEYNPFFEGYHMGRLLLSFDQDSHIQVDLSGQAFR